MVTLNEIFPYIFAPVIVFSIQYIITKFFEIRDKKKKNSIWIKFLRKTNESVNKCYSMFEKIESSNGKWIEFSRPIIPAFSFIVSFILFYIILILNKNVYISMALASFIISIFVLFLVLSLYQYTKEKIDLGDVLNKSNEIKNFYTFINWLFFGISSFIIPSFYLTFEISNQIPNPISISDLQIIRNFYLFSIVFIIMIIFLIFIYRRFFFDNLKSEINTRYLKDFPIVHISTNVEILDGKISYIFDEDYIILDNNCVIKGTQWDEIIIISY